MGINSANAHYTKLLENWVQHRMGNDAGLGSLKKILISCNFIAAAESVGLMGLDEDVIKINPGFKQPKSILIFSICGIILVVLCSTCVFKESVKDNKSCDSRKPIYFGVAQPTPYFFGRKEQVEQLADIFFNRSHPIAVISGMGGQGKTELCRQFIKTLKNLDSPPSVAWLSGDGASVLNSDIIRLAQFLHIPTNIEGDPVAFSEICLHISSHMSSNSPTGWLVIIDNVDEMYPEFLQTISVLIGHGALVLVTSRRIDILSGEAKQMKLELFNPEEAQLLIRNHLNQPKEDVEALCNELGNHALALRQAISFILVQQNENQKSYGIKTYLDDLARSRTPLKNQVNYIDGYDQTIFLIVTRTLQTIQDNHGCTGESAVEVLQILCLIRPDGISLETLQKFVDAVLTIESETGSLTKNCALHKVLLLLKKYSLISYDGQTSVSIHRLIQKVAKRNNSDFVKFIFNAMCKHDISKEEVRHLINIWNFPGQDTIKQYSNFAIRIFTKMDHHSTVLEMKPFAEKNYQLLTQLLGPNHKDTLRMQSCAARALFQNLDYDGALAKYEELLEKQKRILDKDDTAILVTSGSIARILGRLKRYNESLQWHEELLQSQLQLLGNQGTMTTRNNMAYVLSEVGRVDEALGQYHEILEFYENFGDSHRLSLTVRHNMAIILYNQGQYEEAKTEFESVLRLRVKSLGKEHWETLNSQYYLAYATWWLGRSEEALVMLEEVLKLEEKTLGVNHPTTQITRSKVSVLNSRISEEIYDISIPMRVAFFVVGLAFMYKKIQKIQKNQ